ncbi:uncharacterized protein SPPG_08946 [Spizellomyces punctatus DAOM BR117]|uniref:G-patch domain-containing protein n=1 Tax=Spizellomyces punctatus (strain DAOM BR117) TaxID=645134 RepID=A0A0L0HT99_SPIPD|nr:uncharacterized protein SPPG_08946 [Spizellomyces punctatus DAOM BR117]KND04120.1 hypothetical protein SPPG_08946 [Spizellomyces punctatus DAOM BR117]|eukprot:XP_016612159.1 hypothetical protein SPPG_08946 [Spizellomyces punctatus DAOM BR117]
MAKPPSSVGFRAVRCWKILPTSVMHPHNNSSFDPAHITRTQQERYARAFQPTPKAQDPANESDDNEQLDDTVERTMSRREQPSGYLDLDALDQTTMDKHLPESNIGYRLMLKMGWTKGKGLGREGDGRVDPVRIIVKEDTLGVGKGEELDTYHSESTSKRKMLESEKIAEETLEEKTAREVREASIL